MLADKKNIIAEITEANIEKALLAAKELKSIIGHEITAQILSAACGCPILFNRESVKLQPGDSVVVITPNFRSSESREFTTEEVKRAGFRAFFVVVYDTQTTNEEMGKLLAELGTL
jgi:hypothetical protein